ncbi:hypothetical protein AVEN_9069-1 [Araneus ventricosus]|uniref:Uncharacterized protein n=1 Tax=Araneus ventricosus TaxID=182803 RepID=A0A4Y2T7H8_ARAVE|nr:hypothetical protein AVEN_9069-1 [Araneus ventricosus]
MGKSQSELAQSGIGYTPRSSELVNLMLDGSKREGRDSCQLPATLGIGLALEWTPVISSEMKEEDPDRIMNTLA